LKRNGKYQNIKINMRKKLARDGGKNGTDIERDKARMREKIGHLDRKK
jgi:hypothetical protein